ncbi:hypothetical protein GOV11_05040 [Candidatus Woesearchaeota archaeon]|nr:hypothetical protein [Candidatus Woesearchaeota archaeon]
MAKWLIFLVIFMVPLAMALPQGCEDIPIPAGDTIINVNPSQAGQLRNIIMGANSDTTILLADGTYNLGSSYRLEFTSPRVTLRSASGNREAVIIDAGYSSSGAAEIIFISVPDITIADLTLQHAYYHPVHVVSGGDRAILYNLHIIDGREQFIKVNPDGSGYADYGIIACSHLEMTPAGRGYVENGCYTGGIDIHAMQGWKIMDNLIEGIYCDDGSGLAEHGIHVWSLSRDTIVERNIVNNCARGIGFGLGAGSSSVTPRSYPDNPLDGSGFSANEVMHIDGVIRNNFVYSDIGGYFDTGIGLESAYGAEVYHNTVLTDNDYSLGIDVRFPASVATVKNNLLYPYPVYQRDGPTLTESGNVQASSSMFVGGGDLHLKSTATQAINQGSNVGVTTDIDSQTRDNQPDIGADEYGATQQCHWADSDCGGSVGISELVVVINSWISGERSISELVEVIQLWQNG